MYIKKIFVFSILFMLFCIEFIFFSSYITLNIINYYPAGFDQSSYLPEIYRLYQNMQSQGLMMGLLHSTVLPTGFLFPIQHALAMLILGPHRSSALYLNFAYFILLQCCIFYTVKKLTHYWTYAFLFLGFSLACFTPYYLYGGMQDVRIDMMAFSLYGIYVTFVMRSNIFTDRKWTAVSTAIALLLILTRYITAVYLCAIYFLFTLYLLYVHLKEKQPITLVRLKNILMVDAILFFATMIYTVLNAQALFDYYGIGHFLGQEKNIRAAIGGVYTFWENLFFYPKNIYRMQLGRFCKDLYIFISILLAYFVYLYMKINKNNPLSNHVKSSFFNKENMVFLFLTIAIPMVILTVDMNKSAVVAGITVVPILWFILLPCIRLGETVAWRGKLLTAATCIVLLVGISCGPYRLFKQSPTNQEELKTLTQVYLAIGDYAQAHQWPMIKISFPMIADHLNRGDLETLYFEKRGILLNVEVMLGSSIFALSEHDAIKLLQESNVLIVINHESNQKDHYPFDDVMKKLKGNIAKVTKLNFTLLRHFTFNQSTYDVYVRV